MENVNIKCEDEVTLSIPLSIARMSTTLSNLLDTFPRPGESDHITIKITSSVMQILINDFCARTNPKDSTFEADSSNRPSAQKWDSEQIDNTTILKLILAADYLEIKPLLDFFCQAVAARVKGKTPEQIRESFDLKEPFTAEEEDNIRKENEWANETL